MKSIGLIGGTFSNLILAIELSDTHQITLFELNAEIGLPSVSPGYIENKNILTQYLTPQQIDFLQIHPLQNGFTLRSEWALKHLAVLAAAKGVEIFTRTRITECTENPKRLTLHFSGAGPNSAGTLECDSIINDMQWTYQAPGAKHHHLIQSNKIQTPQFGDFTPMHGGTALTSDCLTTPVEIITYPRAEGLTEVWQDSEKWIPEKGWIETIQCTLPNHLDKRSIDAQILEGRRISIMLK
jgi:hypothetical protein